MIRNRAETANVLNTFTNLFIVPRHLRLVMYYPARFRESIFEW